MIYGYISAPTTPVQDVKVEIEQYATQNKLTLEAVIEDSESNKTHWKRRRIWKMLDSASKGTEVIVYEASDIARSTSQVLEALEFFMSQGVILHLVKYNQIFTAEKTVDIKKFLELMQHIESDFVAKRTTEALARRREAGLPLGRPKGKLNKNLKLDKYKKEIEKYLELNISKASIAKLIKCHPQTLYNYMEKRNLRSRKHRTETETA